MDMGFQTAAACEVFRSGTEHERTQSSAVNTSVGPENLRSEFPDERTADVRTVERGVGEPIGVDDDRSRSPEGGGDGALSGTYGAADAEDAERSNGGGRGGCRGRHRKSLKDFVAG